ncbi:SUKH-4 family immunity protein [Streptomyces fumanus]|uniref:Uncharacterized protein n=1 Tax=Streptomyces fumanus TaxID=67302 RepID=A0A919A4I0_9ACTN|nr:SUKH-4 family immunity protein [Streptomyces fumanus]GHE86563.1 hypothetical protein GCM10018772_07840 [Streptomyces fumanus]
MHGLTSDPTTAAARTPGQVPSLLTLARLTTTREPSSAGLFWNPAALIGCLLLSTDRRTASGLALDLPHRLLARDFGRSRIVRFEDLDFPPSLTHEPTRRFLRDTGLPEDAFPLRLGQDDIALPTLHEHYEDPAAPAHLIRLGTLPGDEDAVIDGTTGTILTWHHPTTTLRPLTPDVSTLTYTLWLLHRTVTPEATAPGPKGASAPLEHRTPRP